MLLDLDILNSDLTLNTFLKLDLLNIAKDQAFDLVVKLNQPSKFGIRYIPESGTSYTLSLVKSDGTMLDKLGSNPFADDRSIIKFEITEQEAEGLISQNLNILIEEPSKTLIAKKAKGLRVVTDKNC